MKNLKLPMNVTILSTLLLTGCNLTEPIAIPRVTNGYSIINGDTVKTVIDKNYKKAQNFDPNAKNLIVVGDTILTYQSPKLPAIPTNSSDLSNLKNNEDAELKGKPVRYIAIGGSLTSGVRDGGYFNEGIISSYPNLIARQIRLERFQQPLFDNESYNGFGRKIITGFNPTGGPLPKFNIAKNNSAVSYADEKSIVLKPYTGSKEDIDNFAYPDMTSAALDPRRKGDPTYFSSNQFDQFQMRLNPSEQKKGFIERILQNKFDFFSLELGWGEILSSLLNPNKGGYGPIQDQDKYIFGEENPQLDDFNSSIRQEVRFFRLLEKQGVKKGCILNIPDFTQMPYFNSVPNELLNNVLGSSQFIFVDKDSPGDIFFKREEEFLRPTTEIDSLLSPRININLKKGIDKTRPLSKESINSVSSKQYTLQQIKSYNDFIISLGKRFNYPIVDISSLYSNIFKGSYITHDGIKVDADWKKGNFFSSDGIYPTAFGQAVIANEVIKSLNAYYKLSIPLISTKELLK